MSNKRFYELDALRGIAALLVVMFHYSTKYQEIFGHVKSDYVTTFGFGHYGVQLFFIISGFVIYMSVLKVNSVKDFITKRAIRLYPAYIVAVILTFTVVTLYSLERLKINTFDALVNLTMFQGFIPNMDTVDGVYWSLRVEITFYILMSLLLGLKLQKKIMLLSISWLIFSIVIQSIQMISNNHLILLLESYSISNYSHLFIIGMMFYLLREKNFLKYHLMIGVCLISDFIFESIESGIFTTIFVGLFYLLINGKLKILQFKPLVFLGSISYALYLVHQNIGYVIINIIESSGWIHELCIIIPIVISIGIASVVTYLIEKPIQKNFKKGIRNSTFRKAS